MRFKATLLEDRVLHQGRFALTRTRAEIVNPQGRSFVVDHEVYRQGFAAAVLLYDPDRGPAPDLPPEDVGRTPSRQFFPDDASPGAPMHIGR